MIGEWLDHPREFLKQSILYEMMFYLPRAIQLTEDNISHMMAQGNFTFQTLHMPMQWIFSVVVGQLRHHFHPDDPFVTESKGYKYIIVDNSNLYR